MLCALRSRRNSLAFWLDQKLNFIRYIWLVECYIFCGTTFLAIDSYYRDRRTPSVPFYAIHFDWVWSLRKKESFLKLVVYKQAIDISMVINHLIMGKLESLKLNYFSI